MICENKLLNDLNILIKKHTHGRADLIRFGVELAADIVRSQPKIIMTAEQIKEIER